MALTTWRKIVAAAIATQVACAHLRVRRQKDDQFYDEDLTRTLEDELTAAELISGDYLLRDARRAET